MKNCEYNYQNRRVESKHSFTVDQYSARVSHLFSVLYISPAKLWSRLVFSGWKLQCRPTSNHSNH